MEVWIAIFLLILSALLILLLYWSQKQDPNSITIMAAIIGAIIMFFVMIALIVLCDTYNPPIKPMDVYQGKTTLKYEVVNGIKIDSTVVWKNDKK